MTSLATVGKGVISERRELYAAGWKDCTQAAAMRCCADAGVVFPLAADLDAEREALERSDAWPDEAGAPMWAIVQAMQRRYGYSGAPVTSLASALRTPGFTLLVQGKYSDFPTAQRRWSPAGTFGHAVAYRVLSEVGGTLLDPQAPMGFAGDTVTPAVMEAFAWGASTTRSFPWRIPMKVTLPPVSKTVDIPVHKALYDLNRMLVLTLDVAAKDVYSPFATGIYRAIVRASGELALVKAADCTNVRAAVVASDVKHNWALTEDGKVLWAGTR